MQEVKLEFLKSDGEAWMWRGQLGLLNIFKAKCPGNGMHEGGVMYLDQKYPLNIFLVNN